MASHSVLRLPMIDIGINLMDAMYRGEYNGQRRHEVDIESVLARAVAVGVKCLLITAGSLQESREAVALCKKYNSRELQCFCTVGCHPTRCGEFVNGPEDYYNGLREILRQHTVRNEGGCVAAVGELGLDYDRLSFCEKEVQMTYFVKQLDLAEEFQLPLFLHDRNTGDDLYEVLRQNRARFIGGVVHSFTGTRDALDKLLSLDLFIGLNGCSLKTEENLEVARAVPLNRLMIETDGPWCEIRNTHASNRLLLQAAGRGHSVSQTLLSQFPTCRKEKFVAGALVKSRCEPCHLLRVLEVVYELHYGVVDSLESLARTIYKNTCQLFPFRPLVEEA
ncbi:putative TatD related DNase [Trypanosoma vivax]|uniref:Putative tatD related deoxyribonuclease n=1 Tax=Trypanosoma vivax (strain Y486) TaxID=1055687 RepID=G0UBG6_TRYVY|nr:putative tatD related deoxyribonuclease [Trypanosoma vivax]KAH8612975.1 putative TatD related DNase [Trypanosoma vivax]CCC53162.1 putative tatD related deoxyribonuclease [Trypanosoma vivax Y486]